MKKTLAIILHYNTPELTNRLYESLKPYECDIYDLCVLDNGSDADKLSKYTTFKTEQNCFFGGGLNLSLSYYLENNELYDSMIFLNSDLIISGYNFIKSLKNDLYKHNLDIISPSVIQPEQNQCFWKQMHIWSSNTIRKVKWVDFQCPMFSDKIINIIKQYDLDLIYGWGQDIYSGIICEENNLSIGISDYTPVVHLGSQTIKTNIHKPEISEYNTKAEINMFNYFDKIKKMDKLIEYRNYGQIYEFKF